MWKKLDSQGGSLFWVISLCFFGMATAHILFAQEAETSPPAEAIETPAPVDESPAEPDTAPDTSSSEGSGGETVVVQDATELESGEENATSESSALSTSIIENQNDTSTPVSIDTNLPQPSVIPTHESVEELTLTSSKTQFNFTDQVVFTFTATQPFPVSETKEEVHEESFTDSVVHAVQEVTNSVVEGFSNVTEAITGAFSDVVSFFSGDESENTSEVKSETSNASTSTVDTPVTPQAEEVSQVSIGEEEQATTTESEEVPADPVQDSATASSTPDPSTEVLVDGVPVTSEIRIPTASELQVTLLSFARVPGTHHIVMNIPIAGTYYHWEGEVTWGDAIEREVVLNDMYRVYVTKNENGESLWFVDMSVPGYEYRLLAESGAFLPTTPVTYMNNSIFWLSSDAVGIFQYDVLARTVSSQVLEENAETPMILSNQLYEVAVSGSDIEFTETTGDKLQPHEISF